MDSWAANEKPAGMAEGPSGFRTESPLDTARPLAVRSFVRFNFDHVIAHVHGRERGRFSRSRKINFTLAPYRSQLDIGKRVILGERDSFSLFFQAVPIILILLLWNNETPLLSDEWKWYEARTLPQKQTPDHKLDIRYYLQFTRVCNWLNCSNAASARSSAAFIDLFLVFF